MCCVSGIKIELHSFLHYDYATFMCKVWTVPFAGVTSTDAKVASSKVSRPRPMRTFEILVLPPGSEQDTGYVCISRRSYMTSGALLWLAAVEEGLYSSASLLA